jgi:hypothetical protein
MGEGESHEEEIVLTIYPPPCDPGISGSTDK